MAWLRRHKMAFQVAMSAPMVLLLALTWYAWLGWVAIPALASCWLVLFGFWHVVFWAFTTPRDWLMVWRIRRGRHR